MATDGQLLFTANWSNFGGSEWTKISVFGLSDPDSLSPAGVVSLPDFRANDLAYLDGFLYISRAKTGADSPSVMVIDVSDPSSPTVTRSFNNQGLMLQLEPQGGMLFSRNSIASTDMIRQIEVPTPGQPREGWSLDIEEIDGFVVSESVIAVETPAATVLVDISGDEPLIAPGGELPVADELEIVGSRLFLRDDATITEYDVSDPTSPVLVRAVTATDDEMNPLAIRFLEPLPGHLAFTTNDETGLIRIEPGMPMEVVSLVTTPAIPSQPVPPTGVVVSDDRVCLSFTSPGVAWLEISDPPNLVEGGSSYFPQSTIAGAFGSTALFNRLTPDGSVSGWIDILEHADPPLGLSITHYEVPGGESPLGVPGGGPSPEPEDVFYLPTFGAGVTALEISDPANPVFLGTFLTDPSIIGVDRHDDMIFVSHSDSPGLQIYDVSDPLNPALTDEVFPPLGVTSPETLFISGFAIASRRDLFYAIDLSDPSIISTTPRPDQNAYDSDGESVYVLSIDDRGVDRFALEEGTLVKRAFDISSSPNFGGLIYDLNIVDDLLVLDYESGRDYYLLNDPIFPQYLGFGNYSAPTSGNLVRIDETIVGSGITTIDVTGCDGPLCPADLAIPFGLLDFNDVLTYLTRFAESDPSADLIEPIGVLDFNDVLGFLSLFTSGCP